jgi:hypothetical protein
MRPHDCLKLFVQVTLLLWLGLISAPAMALKFKEVGEKNENLLIYDCGNLKDETSCKPFESHFSGPDSSYIGDAAALNHLLQRKSYSRIFLFSGGGDLDEGVKLGKILRRYSQYVVVPKGASCVSACTVAFLGGVLREVQPGGSYEVHAYSSVLHLGESHSVAKIVSNAKDSEEILLMWAKKNSKDSKSQLNNLLIYVQTMIGGTPGNYEIERLLEEAPTYIDAYTTSDQLKVDQTRILAEGEGALQEVMMRIEREAFESQLRYLKSHVQTLGSRADKAITILEIMFNSRIAGTFKLTPEILRERGYVNVRN